MLLYIYSLDAPAPTARYRSPRNQSSQTTYETATPGMKTLTHVKPLGRSKPKSRVRPKYEYRQNANQALLAYILESELGE